MVVWFKFELIESIPKPLIKLLFHTFLLLFCSKSQHGCPISSKITKLYFDLNITVLAIGLKVIKNFVPLLNFPFNSLVSYSFIHLFKIFDVCLFALWDFMPGLLTPSTFFAIIFVILCPKSMQIEFFSLSSYKYAYFYSQWLKLICFSIIVLQKVFATNFAEKNNKNKR